MFFTVFAPPRDQGITWSNWRSSVAPHRLQRPPSRRITSALTSFEMYLLFRCPSGAAGTGAAGMTGGETGTTGTGATGTGLGGTGATGTGLGLEDTNSIRQNARVSGQLSDLRRRDRLAGINMSRRTGIPNMTARAIPLVPRASIARITILNHFFTALSPPAPAPQGLHAPRCGAAPR